MWEYTDQVMEHFERPRNVGVVARIDGEGQVGSLSCGDALRLTIQVDRDKDIIEDAKFQTFGCASAIASSSALTEMIKGRTVDQALTLTNQDIADFLGGLPREKMHCSVMGQEALEAAVANYRGIAPKAAEGTIVCECFGVTDKEIERVIKTNRLTTAEEVTQFTKAGGGCGKCLPKLADILARILHQNQSKSPGNGQSSPGNGKASGRMTALKRIKLIEEAIATQIAPALMRDGGDIELVDVDGPEVFVTLKGSCAGCPSSKRTLADFVTERLRTLVDPEITVKEYRPEP
ncbi:MAG: Fe-S cluster assembly protein NifU [Deltaproteobacteria bacterium]|jgi:NifU-like protein|nr:Fe-S cluster assembly protein NifU [Deltaproteobacteria bacterium]